MLFQLHRAVWGLEGSPGESLQYLREASSQLPVLFEILRQGMCLHHEIFVLRLECPFVTSVKSNHPSS